ncbi:hypothetical protein ACUNIS_23590, partial [Serratia sp. IR-2025]
TVGWMHAANPEVIAALLAELEAKDKRIAELERANTSQDDHINQQQDIIDSLEKKNGDFGKALGAAEKRLVHIKAACDTWERKAISNFEECASMSQRIEELEKRLATPVRLPRHAPENLASVLDGYEKWLIATTFRDTWNACLDEVSRASSSFTVEGGE